ncbi:MAG: hypothetical protein J0H74_34855, partial [Chitinophagaceae bacterium]|nr:hypothetical protein [Chitinophagaceae bacterium]
MRISLIACLLFYCAVVIAQTDPTSIQAAPLRPQDIIRLGDTYDALSMSIQRRSLHLLSALQSKEARLCRELSSKDSVVARNLLVGPKVAYERLIQQVNTFPANLSLHPLTEYLPGLDSAQTALLFFKAQGNYKIDPSILKSTQRNLLQLQYQLQQAGKLTAFAEQRQQEWLTKLHAFQLNDKMLGIKKKIYYYREELQQYKDLLHDPDRLTTKILTGVRSLPAFQQFFQDHSYLSTLFRLPGNGTPASGQPIPGLQTRASVDAAIVERLGPGASISTAMPHGDAGANPALDGMQDATDQMNKLKAKLPAGNSNSITADFRPNPQHNKTFFHRIQLGFDMQTQSSTYFAPALSTLALTAGYLLNPRSIVGVGVGYKLGWGRPFDHIAFSSQGAVLRSFLDWRLKGSLWIAGAYEANYYNA